MLEKQKEGILLYKSSLKAETGGLPAGHESLERLCGAGIRVLGPESEAKQRFLWELGSFARKDGETNPGDYVILFGFGDGKEDSRAGGWEEFLSLADVLRKVAGAEPKAALFVSHAGVYGKLFGDFHPVKEDELGYVCHTDRQDQGRFRLRMLEHLCARMAREDGFPVKIVRLAQPEAENPGGADGGVDPASRVNDGVDPAGRVNDGVDPAGRADGKASADWGRTVETAVRVLLEGTPGEAYNVSFPGTRDRFSETSALEPYRIEGDSGKAGKLE